MHEIRNSVVLLVLAIALAWPQSGEIVWDEKRFAGAYQIVDPATGEKISYGRRFAEVAARPDDGQLHFYNRRRDALLDRFPMSPDDRILVVGCGFGFLVEVFHDAGFGNVWGIDSSPYIAARLASEARGDVVVISDDIRGGTRVREAFRQVTGEDVFDWIITESMLESYPDDRLAGLFTAMESFLAPGKPAANIIHMLVPLSPEVRQDAGYNWKLMPNWKQIGPSYSWMSMQTFEVF